MALPDTPAYAGKCLPQGFFSYWDSTFTCPCCSCNSLDGETQASLRVTCERDLRLGGQLAAVAMRVCCAACFQACTAAIAEIVSYRSQGSRDPKMGILLFASRLTSSARCSASLSASSVLRSASLSGVMQFPGPFGIRPETLFRAAPIRRNEPRPKFRPLQGLCLSREVHWDVLRPPREPPDLEAD